MITALEGMSGKQHAPAAVNPRERPGTHCTGGWVGLRTRAENLAPTGIQFPDSPVRSKSLCRLSYPAHCEITAVHIFDFRPVIRKNYVMQWQRLVFSTGSIYFHSRLLSRVVRVFTHAMKF